MSNYFGPTYSPPDFDVRFDRFESSPIDAAAARICERLDRVIELLERAAQARSAGQRGGKRFPGL